MTMAAECPGVSIVLPTYNRAQWIGRAIESVLQQSYSDFELIIVDDGSKDNTEAVVRRFSDNRVRYIKHDTNKGANAARNTGIMESKSPIIAFQDSDDEWLPGKLELQVSAFQGLAADVGVVYGGVWRIDEARNTKFYIPSDKVKVKEGDIHRSLLEGNFITSQATAVRAECFKVAGYYDATLPRLQEWELWIRISKRYQFMYLGVPLVNVYYHSDSIGGNDEAAIRALQLILEKHSVTFANAGGRYEAKIRCDLGNLLCQKGERLQGRKQFWLALRLCPWKIRYLAAVLSSLFPRQIYDSLRMVKRSLCRDR